MIESSGYQRMRSARHVTRFFKVENKNYRVKIDELSYGGSILITEMARNRFFHLSLELGCVGWLVKQLQELLEKDEQRFFRRFWGDSYQFWMEKIRNKNGWVLSLTKNVQGVMKTVLVPQGRADDGWWCIKENLLAILKGTSIESSREFPCSPPEQNGIRENNRTLDKTFKEVCQLANEAEEKTKEREKKEGESKWSWVVVCERQAVYQTWEEICKTLKSRFNIECELITEYI